VQSHWVKGTHELWVVIKNASEWPYSLTSTTVVHEPGEKEVPLSSSEWFVMKDHMLVLLEDRCCHFVSLHALVGRPAQGLQV